MRRLLVTVSIGVLAALLLASPLPAQNIMSTFAGGGPNSVPAASANLNGPIGVARDLAGNTYVAVQSAHRVFKIDTSGVLTVFAGSGAQGFTGDGVLATDAALNQPNGVAADTAGNIYIADTGNHRIRKVAVGTGLISTVAGNGNASFSGDCALPGDACPATSATLNSPTGVAVDNLGNLFIADRNNNRVRRVAAADQKITTYAGINFGGFSGDGVPATQSALNRPAGIAFDALNNLFIADTLNNRVRRVEAAAPNNISTVAGTGAAGFGGDGGPATSALLNSPVAVVVDGSNKLYIADRDNQRIRRVDGGTITTFAGTGTEGFTGDTGAAAAAQLDTPTGVATDAAWNVFLADFGNNRVRRVDSVLNVINTFAGNGFTGFGGDGSPAGGASFQNPTGVARDSLGNIFVADTGNHRVRRIDAITGIITTVAGTGTPGFSGDSGLAINAQLDTPTAVALDSADNLYIADTANHRIRRVVGGTITTYAGSGPVGPGNGAFGGDTGPAAAARLNGPTGIVFDTANNLFIADTLNHRVRRVAVAAPNNITTFAGNGTAAFGGDGALATAASLNAPEGVGFDSTGRLLIADTVNNRVRRVAAAAPLNITTVAGNGSEGFAGDGVAAISTPVAAPIAVATDASDNIYISTRGNGGQRIRIVLSSTGNINTIAGNGTFGFGGDGGPAIFANLADPSAILLNAAGNLLIADRANHRIRLATTGSSAPFVLIQPTSLAFGTQVQNASSTARSVTVTNIGSSALTINSITITGANAADFSQTNNCGTSVGGSTFCTINVVFTPTATGDRSATLVISDNAAGSPRNVPLTGTGTPAAAFVGLSRTSVIFGSQIFGSSSSAQTVTLTNTGSLSLTFNANGITVTGANASEFTQTNTCTAALNPGSNCVFTITFTPSSVGGKSAQIGVATNASGSPHTINLSGAGVDFSVSATPATVTVDPGSAADYTLTLTGTAGFGAQINVGCSGLPANSVCTITPNTATVGSSPTTLPMKVTTTSRTATFMLPFGVPGQNGYRFVLIVIAGCLTVFLVWSASRRRVLRPVAALAVVLCLATVLVACGGGDSGSGGTGTPAGTSTITITATSGGVARTATVTLVVR